MPEAPTVAPQSRRYISTPARRPHSLGGCPLHQYLAHVALLVHDYDEALAYFVDGLGFHLVQDTPLAPDKRWVLVAPPGGREAMLLLARAATAEQRAAVGRQGGGRVFLFLHTDNFARDYDAFRTRGIAFLEAPREEAYGTVAVFEDLYGNRWDLIQPRTAALRAPPE